MTRWMRIALAFSFLPFAAIGKDGPAPADPSRAEAEAWCLAASTPEGLARSLAEVRAGEGGAGRIARLLLSKPFPPAPVRRGAVALLAAAGGPDALPALTDAALSDPDKGVRRESAQAISSISGRTPGPALQALSGKDTRRARRAAEVVAAVRDREGVEKVLEIARGSLEIRLDKAEVLGVRRIDVSSALNRANPEAPRPIEIEAPSLEMASIRTSVAFSSAREVEKVLRREIAGRDFGSVEELDRWWSEERSGFKDPREDSSR